MGAEKMPDPRRRELAYQLLNGFMEAEAERKQLSREEMQIAFIVGRIYQHRINLCTRGNLDFEDEDLEAIVSAYEQLNRLCARLMYGQGWHDAGQGL